MKKKMLYGLSAIVLLSVLAMAIPVSAQVEMADEFGVEDAMGNPNTYVEVPVNITNTRCEIAGIQFTILYDSTVINLTDIEYGDLTSTGWGKALGGVAGENVIILDTDPTGPNIIGVGQSGSVVLLNFSVKNVPGESSPMNITDIKLADTSTPIPQKGTAPAKNGTFTVDAGAPIVINPTANPDTIVADGVQESELSVTVSDDIAIHDVTLDLTPIGGEVVHMNNVGNYTEGDVVWCIFNYTTNASIGTPPGIYHLQVNATDLLGNYNNTVSITLNVTLPPTGTIIGRITYACNGTGIAGVTVNLTHDGSVVASTTTDSNGNYTFTDVNPGDYCVNASKPRFWDNSTAVTVTAGGTATANMMLWLKGDLYNDGVLDIYDVIMLRQAVVENIPSDYRFDLYTDGEIDIYDVILLRQAIVGNIVL